MKEQPDYAREMIAALAFAHICYHGDAQLNVPDMNEKVDNLMSVLEDLPFCEVAPLAQRLRDMNDDFYIDVDNEIFITRT